MIEPIEVSLRFLFKNFDKAISIWISMDGPNKFEFCSPMTECVTSRNYL